MDDSKAFFKRKIDFLTKQIEKIQPVLQEKHAMKQGESSYIFHSCFLFLTKCHHISLIHVILYSCNIFHASYVMFRLAAVIEVMNVKIQQLQQSQQTSQMVGTTKA